jgi:hypothetical protein
VVSAGVPARTVRAAVGLMYAGAAVSALLLVNGVYEIIVLASIDDNKIHHMRLPEFTGAIQVPHLSPVAIATGMVSGLVPIAVWLWMARMAAQRRNWVRIVAAALLGVATLEASLLFAAPGLAVRADIPGGPVVALLTWPIAAAAAGLLWCPAATAFDQPHDFAPAQPPDAGPA